MLSQVFQEIREVMMMGNFTCFLVGQFLVYLYSHGYNTWLTLVQLENFLCKTIICTNNSFALEFSESIGKTQQHVVKTNWSSPHLEMAKTVSSSIGKMTKLLVAKKCFKWILHSANKYRITDVWRIFVNFKQKSALFQ